MPMTSDDALVAELAALMQRTNHVQTPSADPAGEDVLDLRDEPGPVHVDLATYEAAHQASQWDDDTAPRVRRRSRG